MKTLPIIQDLHDHFLDHGYHSFMINSYTLILHENQHYPYLIFKYDQLSGSFLIETRPKRIYVEIKAKSSYELITKLFKINNLKDNTRSWINKLVKNNDY